MKKQMVKSPLEMVVQDKKLTMILEQMRDTIKHAGELLIPKEDVCHMREVFCAAVEAGKGGVGKTTMSAAAAVH